MLTINMIIHIASTHLSSESYKAIISLQKGQTRWQGQKLIDFILQCTWKTKFLGTSSERLFRTLSDRISHCIHIVRSSCSQLPARFKIICILVEVVYRPCGWESLYSTIDLAFLGISVKLNLAQSYLHRVEWFYRSSKALWSRINSCYSILFSNMKKRTWSLVELFAVTWVSCILRHTVVYDLLKINLLLTSWGLRMLSRNLCMALDLAV